MGGVDRPAATLDSVLQEVWCSSIAAKGPRLGMERGTILCVGSAYPPDGYARIGTMHGDSENDAWLRACVAILGQQALALLVRHELLGHDFNLPVCPECEHVLHASVPPHAPGCRWDAVVRAAKALRR